MTHERQIQAEDHRMKTQRLIKNIVCLGRDDSAAADSDGGDCAAANTRTREPAPDRPRVIVQCAV
jgi:hypothetical protein